MAYTYDDFLTAATAGGRLNQFSEADLETTKKNPEYGLSMLRLMDDADNATTEEARLLTQSAMDQLRTNYGSTAPTYAGTYDGNVDALLGQAAGYGSFTDAYSGESEYQNMLDEVMNHQPFSYDAATDPSYQAYRKTYLREGDRATENALAKASAATGGTPSSYAVTAATQAGNYHAAQLADKLPALEQQAYQKYLQDFAMKKEKLGVLASDRALAYEEWLKGYDMINQNLGNYQGAAATEWQRYLDQAALDRQAEQDAKSATQAEEDAKQQQYDNALALYEILGYATPEIAAILGIPEGTVVQTGTGDDTGTGDGTGGDTGDGEGAVLGENRKDEIQDWVTANIIDKIDKMPAGYNPERVINESGVFTTAEEKKYALEILKYLLEVRKQQMNPGSEQPGSVQGGAGGNQLTQGKPFNTVQAYK